MGLEHSIWNAERDAEMTKRMRRLSETEVAVMSYAWAAHIDKERWTTADIAEDMGRPLGTIANARAHLRVLGILAKSGTGRAAEGIRMTARGVRAYIEFMVSK